MSRNIFNDNTVILCSFNDSFLDKRGYISEFPNNSIELAKGKFGNALKTKNSTQESTIKFNKTYGEMFGTGVSAISTFTIDFWLNVHEITNSTSTKWIYYIAGYAGVGYNEAAGQYKIAVNGSSVTTCPAMDKNRWYHIAVTCNGTSTYLYVDGVRCGSPTGRNLTSGGTTTCSGFSTGQYLLEEFRISKTVLWDNNFIPPKTPCLDPFTPNILSSSDRAVSFVSEIDVDSTSVYINNVLDKTYEAVKADNLIMHSYNDSLLQNDAVNFIKVESNIDGSLYPNEFEIQKLSTLSQHAKIPTLIRRIEDFCERQEKENEMFRDILASKGITDDLTSVRHEELISYVLLLGNKTQ